MTIQEALSVLRDLSREDGILDPAQTSAIELAIAIMADRSAWEEDEADQAQIAREWDAFDRDPDGP